MVEFAESCRLSQSLNLYRSISDKKNGKYLFGTSCTLAVQSPTVALCDDVREENGEPRISCEKASDCLRLVALLPECVW